MGEDIDRLTRAFNSNRVIVQETDRFEREIRFWVIIRYVISMVFASLLTASVYTVISYFGVKTNWNYYFVLWLLISFCSSQMIFTLDVTGEQTSFNEFKGVLEELKKKT